nr:transposase [Rhodopirellula bahusiensis]
MLFERFAIDVLLGAQTVQVAKGILQSSWDETWHILKKIAKTIQERLPNVVIYCMHGITNAVAEGMNSKIMSIKRRVGGYRDRENFKTAIYFYYGGLDLYPR